MISPIHIIIVIHGFLVAWIFAKIKRLEIEIKYLKSNVDNLRNL